MEGPCFGLKTIYIIFLTYGVYVVTVAPVLPPTPPPVLGCMWKADIVFLLDGSITSNFVNFEIAKNITADIVERLAVNPTDGFIIGLIMFDTGVRQTINLDPTMETKDGLINQIRTLPFTSVVASIDTHLAISNLLTMFLHHGRDMMGKIAVLITDSSMAQPAETAIIAEEARAGSNVRFITLGIGPLPDFHQLFSLTHDNKFILQVVGRPPRDQIHKIVDTLVDRICMFDNPCVGGGEAVIEDMVKLPHPTDCSKFISCSLPTGNYGIEPIYRSETCLFGQLWDTAGGACLPAGEAACPFDPCTMVKDLKSYAINGLCNSFWVCTSGKTNGFACCPQGYRFDSATHSCISDPNCYSTCPNNPLWVVSIHGPTTQAPTTPEPTTATPTTPTPGPSTTATIPADVASFGHSTYMPHIATHYFDVKTLPAGGYLPNDVTVSEPLPAAIPPLPAVVAIRRPTTEAPVTAAPTTVAPSPATQTYYGSYYPVKNSTQNNHRSKPRNRYAYNNYSQNYNRQYNYNYRRQYRNYNYNRGYNNNRNYQGQNYYYRQRYPNSRYYNNYYPSSNSRGSTERTTDVNMPPNSTNDSKRQLELSVRANPLHKEAISKPTAKIERLLVPKNTETGQTTNRRQSSSVPKLREQPQRQNFGPPDYRYGPQNNNYYRQYDSNRQYPYHNSYRNRQQHDYRPNYDRNNYQPKAPSGGDKSFVITDTLVTINNPDGVNNPLSAQESINPENMPHQAQPYSDRTTNYGDYQPNRGPPSENTNYQADSNYRQGPQQDQRQHYRQNVRHEQPPYYSNQNYDRPYNSGYSRSNQYDWPPPQRQSQYRNNPPNDRYYEPYPENRGGNYNGNPGSNNQYPPRTSPRQKRSVLSLNSQSGSAPLIRKLFVKNQYYMENQPLARKIRMTDKIKYFKRPHINRHDTTSFVLAIQILRNGDKNKQTKNILHTLTSDTKFLSKKSLEKFRKKSKTVDNSNAVFFFSKTPKRHIPKSFTSRSSKYSNCNLILLLTLTCVLLHFS